MQDTAILHDLAAILTRNGWTCKAPAQPDEADKPDEPPTTRTVVSPLVVTRAKEWDVSDHTRRLLARHYGLARLDRLIAEVREGRARHLPGMGEQAYAEIRGALEREGLL